MEFCTCAVEILLHWRQTGGKPYAVPCSLCRWQEGDGQFSRLAEAGRPVCTTCDGSGWTDCASLVDSPWVIDSFTAVLAYLHGDQWVKMKGIKGGE